LNHFNKLIFMDTSQENLEKEQDRNIGEAIEDGSYFKEGMKWYSTEYILPFKERAFFILLSIISVFVTYLFIIIISSTLPLSERVPIIIKAKDTAVSRPIINSLKNKEEAKSTEEAVLRFILINYVKEREEHNYKRADIKEVNVKLGKIKNNSSIDVFEDFKDFMGKSNPSSPIHFFGKNVERIIEVKKVAFVQVKKITIFDKMKGFLAMDSLPTKAYIDYTVKTILPTRTINEERRIETTFKFNGVNKDRKTKKFLPLQFIVTEYKKFNN